MALAAALLVTGVAFAHDPEGAIDESDGARDAKQHGDTAGHLNPEGTHDNVALVSKLKLKNVVPEKIADVGVFKGYAYLAAWGVVTCKYNGVHVVDIKNPASPKEVAFIGSKEGSYPGEGVQALHIDTPKFNGDILVTNNEKCKEPAGFGGINIYDISKPTAPTPLSRGFGDSTVSGSGKKAANENHSVFAWDAGDKAYAVMVDNEEADDVDIVDITDPKKPALIAEYNLATRFPQILQAAPANLVEIFLHDMVVKEIGGKQVMLLSYWDAGYVALDMTDPLRPRYLGDTDFADPDPELLESAGITAPPEGNGHQSELTRDNKYLIGADEDFGPLAVLGRNLDDGTADLTVRSGQRHQAPAERQGHPRPIRSSSVARASAIRPCQPAARPSSISRWSSEVCAHSPRRSANVTRRRWLRRGLDLQPYGRGWRCDGVLGHERRGRHPDVRRRAAQPGLRHLRRCPTTTRPALRAPVHRGFRSRSARLATPFASPASSTGGATSTSLTTAPARWPSSTPSPSPKRTTRTTSGASATCPSMRSRPPRSATTWPTCRTTPAASAS
ncbi:MAG: hypothetical protein WKF78_03735 [Candidatus Limnocylindrales bacterium]